MRSARLSRAPLCALAALFLLAACDGGSPDAAPPPDAAGVEGQPRLGSRGADSAPVLRIEGEHARLVGGMREGGDEGASGERYASVPGAGSSDDMQAYAEFAFHTPAAGTYRLHGRVRGPRNNANSFFVQVAGGETVTWHTAVGGSDYVEEYVTRRGEPLEVTLPAGENLVRVYRRENNTRLDWFELVPVSGDAAIAQSGSGAAPVLRIEGEHARLVGDMSEGGDRGASGKRYAGVPGRGSSDDMQSYAEFAFRPPAAGTYRLHGRVRGPRNSANSFFVQVAGGEILTWHTAVGGSDYVEEYVTGKGEPLEVTLPAGESLVRVYRRENDTRLDWLELVPVALEGDAIAQAGGGGGTSAPGGDAALTQRLEAEAARLVGEMREVRDKAASGGRYAGVPGTGSSRDMKAYAEFAFVAPLAGDYRLRARVRGPNGDANSFFVQVAGGEPLIWHTARSGSRYAEEYVALDGEPLELRLSAGKHAVRVYRRERGTRLDWLELERQPSASGEGTSIEIAEGSDADRAGAGAQASGGTVVPAVPAPAAGGSPASSPRTTGSDADDPADGDRLAEAPPAKTPEPSPPLAKAPPAASPGEPAAAPAEESAAGNDLPVILRVEAEDGRFAGAMAVGDDGGASGGRYASVPGSGAGRELEDYVELTFRTAAAASYRLLGRVQGPDKESNSFFVGIGDAESWTWHVPRSDSRYVEEYVNGDGGEVRVWLPAGSHTVRVYRRERGTRLDWLELERVPGEAPEGSGDAVVVTSAAPATAPSPFAPAAPAKRTDGSSEPARGGPAPKLAAGTPDGGSDFWSAAGFGSPAKMNDKERARIAEIERLLASDARRDINQYECR